MAKPRASSKRLAGLSAPARGEGEMHDSGAAMAMMKKGKKKMAMMGGKKKHTMEHE